MHPLPSTTGDFLAPAPSGNQLTGSPSVGEVSFSKHLAKETARELTDDTESALSYGRELVGNAPEIEQTVQPLLDQVGAKTDPQLRIVQNSAASTIDPIVGIQQSQLVNVPGDKNKNASPLMVLLDKLSTQQLTPHPLTGNAESNSSSIATAKSVVPPEAIAQQKQASALQQQMTVLSEILTPMEPATNAAQSSSLKTPMEPVASTLQSSNIKIPMELVASTLQSSSIKTDFPQSTQPGAQSSIPGTVQLTPGNQGSPSVTVEQWSAAFKPIQAQPIHTVNTAVVSPTPLGENVIKTESGQTITIYQSSDNEEMAVTTPLAARPSIVDQSGQRQDANSNYLHSNLPNNTAKAALGAEGDQQTKNGGEQQPDPKNLSSASELGTEPRLNRETAPVTFTLDSVVPAVATPTSPSTPLGAGLMKLPSGVTFPESAVVDQVINHFSGAKKLESGSIRLHLHPQELGELRMEIEVKQDNVKAHITAQNPQAQEALERHLPRLRETLAQQGLHLNEVEITLAAGDQSDGNHFQQNSARHQLGKSYRLGNIPTTGIAPIAGEDFSPVNESKQGLSVTV